jgi:hypothetical protein
MIRRNIFLLLLPIFFVLHGYVVNYNAVPAGEALLLALIYMAVAIGIAALAWLLFRDITKAALFALLVMALQFFYGSIQDMLQQNFPGSFLLRYRFIFPFIIIFFLAIAIWLKKRKKPLQKLALYLDILLLLSLLIDTGSLIVKAISADSRKTTRAIFQGLNICDTCAKPDIYFILPDQYTGNTALKGIFNFDNSAFIEALQARGFYVAANSSSNYNLTPFSVASTLNMDYIKLKEGAQDYGSVSYSYNLIRHNHVMNYLTSAGYRFYNCSIFDFEDQPANEYGAFLPYGVKLITSQTFTARLEKDFHTDILAGKFGKGLQKKYAYEYMRFNDDILQLTRDIANQATEAPKFVYTHLMMPHYPYYFDSSGKALPLEKLTGLRKANPKDYIGYLQYTNKKLLELADHILKNAARPPVIILLGDHGFRHPDMKTDPRYDYMNLNAVYIPNRNYSGFYDSMTNVNQFRVLFNTCFNQQLPLLRDSTIDVWPD